MRRVPQHASSKPRITDRTRLRMRGFDTVAMPEWKTHPTVNVVRYNFQERRDKDVDGQNAVEQLDENSHTD